MWGLGHLLNNLKTAGIKGGHHSPELPGAQAANLSRTVRAAPKSAGKAGTGRLLRPTRVVKQHFDTVNCDPSFRLSAQLFSWKPIIFQIIQIKYFTTLEASYFFFPSTTLTESPAVQSLA